MTRTIVAEPELFTDWLEECLTFRQLRKLAKRHNVRQYSYLNKRRLAMSICIQAYNRYSRNHGKKS